MYETTLEIANPPTVHCCVNLKYQVPVASPVSPCLPVVQPEVSLNQVTWYLEYESVNAVQFVGVA